MIFKKTVKAVTEFLNVALPHFDRISKEAKKEINTLVSKKKEKVRQTLNRVKTGVHVDISFGEVRKKQTKR